ncbi:MAG: DUF2764 family protein [Candidatus Omnitrophota bacterium]
MYFYIMDKYYYLTATLPYLRFGREIPISKEFFLAESGKWLLPADVQIMESVDLNNVETCSDTPGFLKEWKEFNLQLKKDLAKLRRAKKNKGAHKTPERLRPIMEQENPLLMEIEIERMRWAFVEEKSAGHYFDLEGILLYFLKLQIVERIAGFNKDEGEKFFYKLCEVNHEQAKRHNNGR